MENKTNSNEKNEINELNKKIAQLEERIGQLEIEMENTTININSYFNSSNAIYRYLKNS